MGNLRSVPGNRRPSPGRLLLALVLVCAAPLGVAVATGLVDGHSSADQVETAGDDVQQAAATTGAGDDSGRRDAASGSLRSTPPPTGIADIPPADRAPSPGTGTPPAEAPPDTAAATTTTAPPAAPAATTLALPPTPAEQVLALVNDARAHAATPCGPVQLDPRLMAAAQAHSDDMAARNFFDHTNPDGVTFAQRILAAGYPQVAMAENIENCAYNFMGLGVNQSAWTWTQDFAA